jgi:hypothetical protein
VPGDTVTVQDASADSLCTAVVGTDGSWSCVTSTLTAGPLTLSATQADDTNDASPVSNTVGITVPSATSVTLGLTPAAPKVGQPVTLTATTTGVADGTTVTFADAGTAILGATAAVSGGTASYLVAGGLSVGAHSLTASVPPSATTLGSTSPPVGVTVGKTASTISLRLTKSTTPYGHPVGGLIAVSASGGAALVRYGSRTISVPIGSGGGGSFALPATFGVGAHKITAAYEGNATVAASAATSVILHVTKAPTTTKVTLGAKKLAIGKAEKIAVKVGGHASGSWPSGTVKVTAKLGHHTKTTTATLKAAKHGKVAMNVKLPAFAGSATLVVSYRGSASFKSSTAKPKTVVITSS